MDEECLGLVRYAGYHNDPCVSSYDHICPEMNVVVIGTSTYMKDVEIVETGTQVMKVSEERNGLNVITSRYTDITITFTNEFGRKITGPISKPHSYCVQYHLNS